MTTKLAKHGEVAGVRALLSDGGSVWIRPVRTSDEQALLRLHDELSDRSMYLRFFSVSRVTGESFARHVARDRSVLTYSLVAEVGGRIAGLGTYEGLGEAGEAEVSFAVAEPYRGRGIATLLLEHLVTHARRRGVRRFVAEVLAENSAMIGVFRDAGLTVHTRSDGSVLHMVAPVIEDEQYLDAVGDRERGADVASLRPLLRPRSVAVIGATDRPGSVGMALVEHLLGAGYRGRTYFVNPHGGRVAGQTTYRTVQDITDPPELAVIAVPAERVPAVLDGCGEAGVDAAVIISAGLPDDGAGSPGRAVIDTARRYGMRLLGPNCLGVADTDPLVRLDATFARGAAVAGGVGVVTQSGGVGIALLHLLPQAGLGVSTFASTGDKFDVSSNDLLMWWDRDPRTRAAIMYVESFGNPRKFARLARHLGHTTPLIAVRAGASPAAQQAALSHTAATATSPVTRDALFCQAGVIATDGIVEAVQAAAMLSHQPLPRGNRVVVVSNAGGAGVLAADDCTRYGLTVPRLSATTRQELAQLLPDTASLDNPVDATAGVAATAFTQALDLLSSVAEVDALLVVVAPTALEDLGGALDQPAAGRPLPLAGVLLGEAAVVSARQSGQVPVRHCVPIFPEPGDAARALGHAASYAAWRRREPGTVPPLDGIDVRRARKIVAEGLAGSGRGDGWLPGPAAEQLAASYGVLLATGDDGRDVVVELLVGVVQDEAFGPLLSLGAGGTDADLLDDRTARLLPLTDVDVAEMVAALRIAPLLTGYRGAPPCDVDAVSDTVHRVARLVEDLPEIAELELNPLIVHERGCNAGQIKIRLAPREAADP